MLKQFVLTALVFGVATACSAQVGNPDDSAQQAAKSRGGSSGSSGSAGSTGSSGSTGTSSSCSNPDGIWSAAAALAASAAKELHRWQPLTDFYIDFSTGGSGYLALTSTGKSQCSDGKCAYTQALLDLQRAPNGTVKFHGTAFVADNYRSTLTAKFNDQIVCESRPDNHQADNCPAEQHKLTQASVSKGSCDTVFTFNATTPSGGTLSEPAQLKNKLIWVGGTSNTYLNFQSNGTTVSIDPTAGLNEASTTTSGSCTAACNKVSLTSVAGQCCTCNGVTGSYAQSSFSTLFYVCQ